MSDQEEANHDGNGAGAVSDPGVEGEVDGQRRLATVEAERDEMKDRMLRIAADFENWKKRARKEQEDAEAKVREGVLKDVLDVMDNLERAVSAYGQGGSGGGSGAGGATPGAKGAAAPAAAAGAVDGAAILKGVGLVLRLLQSKLERYGVKPIETQGQLFDPRLHEAISRSETASVPPGHVAAELQRGYRIGERLLRPSMVSVATAPGGGGGGGGGERGAGDGGSGTGGVGDHGS